MTLTPINPFSFDLTRARSLSSHSSLSSRRQSLLTLCRAAERCERFADLHQFVKELIQTVTNNATSDNGGNELSGEERALLYQSVRTALSYARLSRRTLKANQSAVASASHSAVAAPNVHARLPVESLGFEFGDLLEDYKQHVDKEINAMAVDIIALIEPRTASATDAEAKLFYLRLCADCYRHRCELMMSRVGYTMNGAAAGNLDVKTIELYAAAYAIAQQTFAVNHPERLHIVLNYAVALAECRRDRPRACELAKSAFDAAINRLDELDENQYKDATLVMQLIRDNITLWTAQETQAQQQQMMQQQMHAHVHGGHVHHQVAAHHLQSQPAVMLPPPTQHYPR